MVGRDHGFSIEVSKPAPCTFVLVVRGEFDTANSDAANSEIRRVLRLQPGRLIFDLSEVSFMSSAGLGCLIVAMRAAPSVLLRNPSRVVRRVLELTGTDMLVPTESAA